jgi:hypothetical protein
MNGTTNVSGSKTFDARELFISKSGLFNGNLIIKDSADNTLVTIGKEEITPRFKVVSLWPTPTSITVYMEYYKKIKELNADDEAPEFDPKFHHVVRLGTLAKTYQLLGKTNDFVATQELYAKMVRSWVQDDSTHPDSIDYIKKRDIHARAGVRLHLSEDVII